MPASYEEERIGGLWRRRHVPLVLGSLGRRFRGTFSSSCWAATSSISLSAAPH